MKQLSPETDYRRLTPEKLKTPEFSHLWLLLYWPLYGIAFFVLERMVNADYHYVECAWDAVVPFCEYFIIPYYFWFVFLIGMIIYSLLFSIETFKKFMWYIIITNTITLIIYAVYPTAQNLRPTDFQNSNIFTRIAQALYAFDTNTNVCPSLHVINSFAVLFAAWNDKNLCTPVKRGIFTVITLLICASTVFLKQHSVIDVAAALVLCVICYPFAFTSKWYVENFIGFKGHNKVNFVKNP